MGLDRSNAHQLPSKCAADELRLWIFTDKKKHQNQLRNYYPGDSYQEFIIPSGDFVVIIPCPFCYKYVPGQARISM